MWRGFISLDQFSSSREGDRGDPDFRSSLYGESSVVEWSAVNRLCRSPRISVRSRNGAVESDGCEKMNASVFNAMESAANSILLGFVDLRLAFVWIVTATRKDLMIVSMGPHHPSMHGVLQLIVTLDGGVIVDVASAF
ncbi:hypothetical protein ACH5RR_032498 [Cinchona calisaya]|uniref:NADH dehydrogenase subunit 7 n=1 Tax=Cinchona calisaya TaxID=153742 RepID=A0ABD2YK89_9GENT